jgi:hypothetical protein
MTRLSTRHGASLSPDPAGAVQEIRQAIDQPGLAAVILFCSPGYDLEPSGGSFATPSRAP